MAKNCPTCGHKQGPSHDRYTHCPGSVTTRPTDVIPSHTDQVAPTVGESARAVDVIARGRALAAEMPGQSFGMEMLTSEYHMADSDDPESTARDWWFAAAENLHATDPTLVPSSWEFRPSPLGYNPADHGYADERIAELVEEGTVTSFDLIQFGDTVGAELQAIMNNPPDKDDDTSMEFFDRPDAYIDTFTPDPRPSTVVNRTGDLPAGTYFIGDPCYAVPREQWGSYLETGGPNYDVAGLAVQLPDERHVAAQSTTYGDGVFRDQDGTQYGVDAGMIGAVEVRPDDDTSRFQGLGQVVTFNEPVTVSYDNGTISIGHLHIPTGSR